MRHRVVHDIHRRTVVPNGRLIAECDTPIYHIGIQFLAVSRSMRDKIIRYLFQVQRAQVERVRND